LQVDKSIVNRQSSIVNRQSHSALRNPQSALGGIIPDLTWWRGLRQNPVYRRERGGWGRPNPFYDALSRYSPFVLLAVIVLGACAGFGNPALFSGNDALIFAYCLLCLPGMLLSMVTLYGQFMAPALTAPMVTMEVNRGTWDILRTTPQPTRRILLAKLLGALGRLRIWTALLLLSLLQAILIVGSFYLVDASLGGLVWLLGLATLARPWSEILFAGMAGVFFSTLTRSAPAALAGSYGLVATFKLINNSPLWMAVGRGLAWENTAVLLSIVAPTAVYALVTAALWQFIRRRAEWIGANGAP
jgi:hypothetical protein